MEESILLEIKNRIAGITLNRPKKRNALNSKLVTQLITAFQQAEADSEVKAIVLKSSGEIFSAGADLDYLKQLQENKYEENLKDSSHLGLLFSTIYNLEKPVIAQVEGNAIAGGCGLISVCDVVFAVPGVLMGYTEVKIGFVPALVATFLLRKIGEGRSREMLLSGELITAETAYRYGLINFIVSKASISEAVNTYAENLIAGTSSQSIKTTKVLLRNIAGLSLEQSLDYAAKVNAEARLTEDFKKGLEAFLNKKPLKW